VNIVIEKTNLEIQNTHEKPLKPINFNRFVSQRLAPLQKDEINKEYLEKRETHENSSPLN
jgi:hypothetical protein